MLDLPCLAEGLYKGVKMRDYSEKFCEEIERFYKEELDFQETYTYMNPDKKKIVAIMKDWRTMCGRNDEAAEKTGVHSKMLINAMWIHDGAYELIEEENYYDGR